jgi:hypothetical protein
MQGVSSLGSLVRERFGRPASGTASSRASLDFQVSQTSKPLSSHRTPTILCARCQRWAKMKYLEIVHLPQVTDITPLEALSCLESLSLATLPSWDSSGRVQEVVSLASLVALPSLHHLELFGVVPLDRSLVPLQRCKALKSARFSSFPEAEVKHFYETTGVSDAFNPQPVFSAA